jgi:hypothetical protein
VVGGIVVKDDWLTFSTGKRAYANQGIIGLGPRSGNDAWRVSEGYDGGFVELTKEEKRELADYMIALWREWRDAA